MENVVIGKSVGRHSGLNGKLEALMRIDSIQQMQKCTCDGNSGIEHVTDAINGDGLFCSDPFQAEDRCSRSSKGNQVPEDHRITDVENSGEIGLQLQQSVKFPAVNCRWVGRKPRIKRNVGVGGRGSGSQIDDGYGRPSMAKQGPIQIGQTVNSSDRIYRYPCTGAAQHQIRVGRQTSLRERVAVVGRPAKDVEISVFDAEMYFSDIHEDESKDPDVVGRGRRAKNQMEIVPERGNNSGPQIKGLFTDIMVDVESAFRPRILADSSLHSNTVHLNPATSDSLASWNSQSGLLSKGGGGFPFNGSSRPKSSTTKWRIRCRCPCSDNRSVEVDHTLLDLSGRNVSVSTSLQSSYRGSPHRSNDSGLNSVEPNDIMNIGMAYCHEKKKIGVSVINRNEKLAHKLPSIGTGSSGGFPGLQTNQGIHPNSPAKSYMEFENEFVIEATPDMGVQKECSRDQEEEGAIPVFKPKAEGFSFPILGASPGSPVIFSFPEQKPRSPVLVFGSPDRRRDYLRKSLDLHNRSMGNLQRSLRPFPLEKAKPNATEIRRSFSFPRMSLNSDKFDGQKLVSKHNRNAMELNNAVENSEKDPDSDSSSDLFEIESFSTEVGSSYPTYSNSGNSLESIHTSSFPSCAWTTSPFICTGSSLNQFEETIPMEAPAHKG